MALASDLLILVAPLHIYIPVFFRPTTLAAKAWLQQPAGKPAADYVRRIC